MFARVNWRQRVPTWDGWYYWSMDVLPAAGGSWFGLDGSKSARVQPAPPRSGTSVT